MGLQAQVRLENNSSELRKYFYQLSTEYKLSKKIDLELGLRYLANNDNTGNVQGIENSFRYNLDASYGHSVSRFKLKYRLRFTNENELGLAEGETSNPDRYLRLKASSDYNIKNWKLDPKIGVEIFNKQSPDSPTNGFNKLRVQLGTEYGLGKAGEIGIAYLIQQELVDFYPKTLHVLRLKYSISL